MHRDFAERFSESTLLFQHAALLGGSDDVADIVAALDKVRASLSQLSGGVL